MNGDDLERLARALVDEYALPPDDWEPIAKQARAALAIVAELDQLPLDTVEPAAVYRIVP
jgi:hypothetical protein